MTDPRIERGVVAADVAEEFPALAVRWVTVPGAPGPVSAGVRDRLDGLAARIAGAQAIALRHGEVPHAHRVFFRHVGIDPDVTRTPAEEAMVGRLVDGGFPVADRIAAACLVAVVETGVGVWAVDAARAAGPVEVRTARAGERLGEGERADDLVAGRLVLADDRGPLAVLFGRWAPDRLPGPRTEAVRLVALQVPGVPDLHLEEALWTAADALAPAGR